MADDDYYAMIVWLFYNAYWLLSHRQPIWLWMFTATN